MRKNIFLIGRKGHERDENQLTEMLAYLFQEERDLDLPQWLAALDVCVQGIDGWEVETQRSVPDGFLDLVLFYAWEGPRHHGVEARLDHQLRSDCEVRDLCQERSHPGTRALVFTTQSPEPWPAGVEQEAGDEVRLILKRWQSLGDFLYSSERPLAQDFAAMLEKEGLVTPTMLTNADWET